MPDVDVTLDPTASDEQPVDQVVESAEGQVDGQAPETSVTSTETVEPTPEPRLFAGKYKTDVELEQAYQSANAENSRMAAELAAMKRQPVAPKADAPKYTTDQLETWKEGRLRELAQQEAAAARLVADGNMQGASQHSAAAQEAARQIRLIDAELRKSDISSTMQQSSRQAAEQRLVGDAVGVIQHYKADLTPGTPLYDKASEFLSGYEAMGMDPQNVLVQAQAVAMAAQRLGLSSTKVEQNARKTLTNSINQALKSGVQSGGGKGGKVAAAPNFDKMTDAEFTAYKAQRGWD